MLIAHLENPSSALAILNRWRNKVPLDRDGWRGWKRSTDPPINNRFASNTAAFPLSSCVQRRQLVGLDPWRRDKSYVFVCMGEYRRAHRYRNGGIWMRSRHKWRDPPRNRAMSAPAVYYKLYESSRCFTRASLITLLRASA